MNEGVCLCGAVRYRIAGPFTTMAHCHCSMCRKHHGALYATFAIAPLEGFEWLAGEDHLDAFQSSEQGVRRFCRTCGAVAPTLVPAMGIVVAPAGNLEGDPGVRPSLHMFVASKASFHDITDDLPQHAGYPAEWGGGLGVERPAVTPREGIVEGSCLCGDVAYELTTPARRAYHCHCSRCRRGRSAAHATNYFYDLAGFRFVRGEASVRTFKVPEARFFTVAFCARCGGGAPRVAADRGIAAIPAGTFDVDPGLRAGAHIYVASKAPWDVITDAVPQFDEMPG